MLLLKHIEKSIFLKKLEKSTARLLESRSKEKLLIGGGDCTINRAFPTIFG